MEFTFSPPKLKNFCEFAIFENAFTSEECDLIRSLFKDPTEALVGGGVVLKRDHSIRKSDIHWIYFSEEVRWIYEKISNIVMGCNNERYGFQLSGIDDALQIGRYSDGGHYDWHQDFGQGPVSNRKLSISVQLDDPSEYTGGKLQFIGLPDNEASFKKGSLTIFPSFMTHRVTPVTEGVRHSLVSWIVGHPFR
jgi:PKHD-type hydroxylase